MPIKAENRQCHPDKKEEKKRYAGTPGKGPAGMSCRKCGHLYRRGGNPRRRVTNECTLVPIAVRDALWTGTAACEEFKNSIPSRMEFDTEAAHG